MSRLAFMFDLGGVIVAHDNALLFRRIAGRCTRPDHAATIHRLGQVPGYGTGALPITHLHAALVQEAGYQGDWACFLQDWSCHFAVDPRMLRLVQQLAAACRVVLFSNTNFEHWDYLDRTTNGALRQLEAYLSHELGMMKPDPAAFTEVVRRAGLDAATTVFIDDVAANVEGARIAGLIGVHFTGETALRRELAAIAARLGQPVPELLQAGSAL